MLVTVSANTATRGTLELGYVTPNAGWYSHYDLRVQDAGSPIAWTYNANVVQSTGESWEDVRLTLSTGDPNQSGTRPELSPF